MPVDIEIPADIEIPVAEEPPAEEIPVAEETPEAMDSDISLMDIEGSAEEPAEEAPELSPEEELARLSEPIVDESMSKEAASEGTEEELQIDLPELDLDIPEIIIPEEEMLQTEEDRALEEEPEQAEDFVPEIMDDMDQATESMVGTAGDIKDFLKEEDFEFTEITSDGSVEIILIKMEDDDVLCIEYEDDEFLSLISHYEKDGNCSYKDVLDSFIKDSISKGISYKITRSKGGRTVSRYN